MTRDFQKFLRRMKGNLCMIFPCKPRMVGADGPTHHGTFDLAYFRCVPNMVVAAPMNEQELRNMMYTAQLEKNALPFSIRYPRGNGVMVEWKTPFEELVIGKGRKVKDGKDVAILSIGAIGNSVAKAIAQLEEAKTSVAHYDMRFVKPLDEELLHQVFAAHKKVITVEDGCIQGGFGSAVLEFMADNNYNAQVKRLGVPDEFIEHGDPAELYEEVGLSPQRIAEETLRFLSSTKKIMAG